jgi:exodeoxyribonuclease VIII
MSINGETVYWWMKQSDAARESVISSRVNFDTRFYITPVLVAFESFVRSAGMPDEVWSHATFDFVILKNAYKAAGLNSFPFNYQIARDIRTITAITGGAKFNEVKREGTHHDALDDCIYQAKYVSLAYQSILLKKDLKK